MTIEIYIRVQPAPPNDHTIVYCHPNGKIRLMRTVKDQEFYPVPALCGENDAIGKFLIDPISPEEWEGGYWQGE